MAIRNGNRNPNFLFGTFGNDEIHGRGGNDFLFGFFGNDIIRGGNGNDFMFGGGGSDRLLGGNGDDIGFGGSGNDRLVGGRGSDLMFGGSGNDTFVYRAERNVGETDFYSGGSGNDRLVLRLNEAEAADADIQADIAAFEAFLASGGGGNFTFESLGLTVNGIERLTVRAPEPEPTDNGAPVVNGIVDLGAIDEDSARSLALANLLAGASDPDGDPLSVTGITVSSGNAVIDLADGIYTITPDADDDSAVTLSYTIEDGNGGSVAQTATLDLLPVNDAPVTPDDALSVDESGTAAFFPGALASDVDSAPLTFAFDDTGSNGSVQGGDLGEIVYTPGEFYNSLAEGEIATDTFTYSASDGALTSTGTVTVTITGENDAPVAMDDDFAQSDELIPLLVVGSDGTPFDVLANDFDPDGDTLRITDFVAEVGLEAQVITGDGGDELFIRSLGNSGELEGGFGFFREATLQYTVSDGALEDTATLTFLVEDDFQILT